MFHVEHDDGGPAGQGEGSAGADALGDVVDTPSPDVLAGLGPGADALARYARMLGDEGVLLGLLGPRELPRLWERHLLNSAALVPLLPESGTVVDVGSGAGLPGVVLACLRPDLDIVLLEPMERRVAWLERVVGEVGLAARVVRGRAEEQTSLRADAVVARAVAPLDRLAGWTLPLLTVGGVALALKGDRATAELAEARDVIAAWGGNAGEVLTTPVPGGGSTQVVRIVREVDRRPARAGTGRRRRSRG